MRLRHMIAIAAVAASMSGLSQLEAKPGWTVIAEQTVGKGGDTDTVHINNMRKFQSVRICVRNRPVHLNSFSVQFRNGGRQSLDVRSNFKPGTCSRPIDLKGERRHIEWVMLNYHRRPGEGAPVVRIQAR